MAAAIVLAGVDVVRAGDDCKECPEPPGNGICLADLTGDGIVDDDDYDIFVEWITGPECEGNCCPADLDRNGVVDECDICIMNAEYSGPCTGYALVKFEVWDPQCYDPGCSDSDCSNDPASECCGAACPGCLAAKGCLPVSRQTAWFFDLDGDGWIDAVTRFRDEFEPSGPARQRIFWNEFSNGALVWQEGCLVDDINVLDPNNQVNGYGMVVGDINNDSYADYANEPGSAFFFLINKGNAVRCSDFDGFGEQGSQCDGSSNANFVEAQHCWGIDPTGATNETACFGDGDGDGDLDFLASTYANRFYFNNAGPNDPNCDAMGTADPAIWRMIEMAQDAGLRPGSTPSRPEGVQWCDYDHDFDLDIFVEEEVYQNRTVAADDPTFVRLFQAASGLDPLGSGFAVPEEGFLLADIDMDGDQDVIHVSTAGNGFAADNRGDGTFGENVLIVQATKYGTASCDMDNDGDIDLTVGHAFVRNTLVEEVSSGNSPSFGSGHMQWVYCSPGTDCHFGATSAHRVPSFGDVDRDGDQDCAFALFQSDSSHKFLRNTLYGEACQEPWKRYVNVRPVRPLAEEAPSGRDYTENEFGARVELVLRNDPVEETRHLRRVQFTASSSGYLNQNEYLLHFGLPRDPDPNDPNEDLRFDLYVDFPSRSNEPNDGPIRIDWTVNSQLSGGAGFPGINLADLYVDPNDPNTFGRPVTVYRDGRINLKTASGMQTFDPNDPNAARLYTLAGALTLPPDPNTTLPDLTTGSKLAGLRFTKASLAADPNGLPIRIREIICDAQLDQSTEGCDFNVAVLDVTDPNNPQTIGAMKAYTFAGNRRTFIPVPPDPNDPNAFVIYPHATVTKTYDVRVRVTKYRPNALSSLSALNFSPLGVTVTGGLVVIDSSGKDICEEVMSLQNPLIVPFFTSPVKVRLSAKND